ncbi:hypothetical protein TcCL_Unassigned03990, partial [Trypanosoma cruzi]
SSSTVTVTAIAHLQKRHNRAKRANSRANAQPRTPTAKKNRLSPRAPSMYRAVLHFKATVLHAVRCTQNGGEPQYCPLPVPLPSSVHGKRRQPTAGGEMRDDRPWTPQYFVRLVRVAVCASIYAKKKTETNKREKHVKRHKTHTRQRCRGMKEEENW